MGGAYHSLLAQAALAGAVCLLGFFGALAWSESSGVADGSILAARLRDRLPGLAMLLPAVTVWYATAEAIEPHHAGVSPIAALFVLVAVTWLVLRFARSVVALLAGAVIAVSRMPFSPRAPSWQRRPRVRPLTLRAFRTRRRFARPPPIAIVCA
jgi:hypothetical protein